MAGVFKPQSTNMEKSSGACPASRLERKDHKHDRLQLLTKYPKESNAERYRDIQGFFFSLHRYLCDFVTEFENCFFNSIYFVTNNKQCWFFNFYFFVINRLRILFETYHSKPFFF